MKKIAVFGTGKTGGEVLKILKARSDVEIFALNRSTPPTEALWRTIDAAIVFVPGEAFLEHFDLFLKIPRPLVVGSTGFALTPAQRAALGALPCPWVMSSNFSLGMALARGVISQMARWTAASGLKSTQSLSETHHVHKKDAPSGTALLWREWIERASSTAHHGAAVPEIEITSHRTEDFCGTHEYRLDLPQESMTFRHEATSRAVFAEGAVWALDALLTQNLTPGCHDFFELVERTLP